MRRVVLAGFVLGLLAVTAFLFLPPPRFLIRSLGIASASMIMRGSSTTEGGWKASGSRLLGAYLQMGLASQLSDRLTSDSASDEEALYRIVRFVHRRSLNQEQLAHIPRSWPVLISGLGYCDQINAAVATIAASRFEKAQIYATYDESVLATPHTIGRVWSESREDWLYFDAFYASPVIFTKDAEGRAHFLTIPATQPIPERGSADRAVYSLPGWTLAEFPSTLGPFLYSRVSTSVRARLGLSDHSVTTVESDDSKDSKAKDPKGTDPKGADEGSHVADGGTTATAAPVSPPLMRGGELSRRPVLNAQSSRPPASLPPLKHRNDEVFEQVAREYVEIRVSEILGEPAEETYDALAHEPKAELDDRAVQITEIAARLASLPIE